MSDGLFAFVVVLVWPLNHTKEKLFLIVCADSPIVHLRQKMIRATEIK